MSRVAAYQRFKDRLFSGLLSPGQFVTQKELAELAGVPLSTARDAIQKLEHESLLKVHPQRGIQITDVTTKFIRDSFGLRKVLELQAVRSFASEDNGDVVSQLLTDTEKVLAAARDGLGQDVLDKAVEVDWEMHDKIIDHMENALLSETYRINAARLRLIKANNRLSQERAVEALGEHLAVLENCRAGDGEQAAAALGEHIDIAMNRALQGK